MDTRNPPYNPRYCKPPELPTILTPRKTVHPSTDELLAAHKRAELRFKAEKADEERQKVRKHQQQQQELERQTPVRDKQGLLEAITRSTSTTKQVTESILEEFRLHRSPRGVADTKTVLAHAGLSHVYPVTSLITSTLESSNWFRISQTNQLLLRDPSPRKHSSKVQPTAASDTIVSPRVPLPQIVPISGR